MTKIVNKMTKNDVLKLERQVKDVNLLRRKAPITAGPGPIMHNGNTLSFKGHEEAKSRSKSQMRKMIIRGGSKRQIDLVICKLTQGKNPESTLNDLPQLSHKVTLKEVNPEITMHNKATINQSRCPNMQMLRNFYIKKSK